MTGLFDQLVARANGDAETVRPRPRLQFHTSDAPIDIEWREANEAADERGALRPASFPTTRDRTSQSGAQANSITKSLMPLEQRPLGRAEDVAAKREDVRTPDAESPDNRADQPDRTPVAPLLSEKPEEPRRIIERAGRQEIDAPSGLELPANSPADGENLEHEASATEAFLPEVPAAELSPERVELPASDQALRDDASEPTAPTIHIGRIEVRPPAPAVNASPVAKLPMRPRAAPRQSLDDFLSKRRC